MAQLSHPASAQKKESTANQLVAENLAIQTTKSVIEAELYKAKQAVSNSVHDAILKTSTINILVVTYIDHRTNDWYSISKDLDNRDFNPAALKNVAYSYEREVRIVCDIRCPNFNQRIVDGIRVPVDSKSLIKKIFVSPTADNYFFDLVKGIVKQYGFDDIVDWSSLRYPLV